MSAWVVAVLAALAVLVWAPAGAGPVRSGPAGRGPAGRGPAGRGPAGRGPAGPRGGPLIRSPMVTLLGRRRAVAADQAAVLEVCDLLAAELAAGRPPSTALATASERWPPLVAAVEAARLGADVPDALRRLALEHHGAADLRWVAGAWQVAHHSGHGLCAALERTARSLRARRRTSRLVDSELASARATSRLVACLPLAVLLMGSGAGSDPWTFLLTTPIGGVCLSAGLALIGLGLWWIERLADGAAAP